MDDGWLLIMSVVGRRNLGYHAVLAVVKVTHDVSVNQKLCLKQLHWNWLMRIVIIDLHPRIGHIHVIANVNIMAQFRRIQGITVVVVTVIGIAIGIVIVIQNDTMIIVRREMAEAMAIETGNIVIAIVIGIGAVIMIVDVTKLRII
ncbi:hypothetical protein X798_06609 [Onchocerca flexuosa]|uniref:Uncharacterized protein n=1 Tax=Onchocerca flexuosa TaxID=387005 RepID=A0A238BP29_9BILA|nr:hypothetical protein X798_06609 [Onchocerca flexuosa]